MGSDLWQPDIRLSASANGDELGELAQRARVDDVWRTDRLDRA
jgi:hypothetical protein